MGTGASPAGLHDMWAEVKPCLSPLSPGLCTSGSQPPGSGTEFKKTEPHTYNRATSPPNWC